jgi:hypothetical protein
MQVTPNWRSAGAVSDSPTVAKPSAGSSERAEQAGNTNGEREFSGRTDLSGRRESNPRHTAWEAGLQSLFFNALHRFWHRFGTHDFVKSCPTRELGPITSRIRGHTFRPAVERVADAAGAPCSSSPTCLAGALLQGISRGIFALNTAHQFGAHRTPPRGHCFATHSHRPYRFHSSSFLTAADTASRTLPYWYRDKVRSVAR